MSKCHDGCDLKISIPDDARITCGFAQRRGVGQTAIRAADFFEYFTSAAKIMGFEKISEHGYKNHQCFFPIKFDPIWLEGDCNHFKEG